MGKVKPNFFKGHSMRKLTHSECRAKVCLVCFEVKKSLRDISGQNIWIGHIKTVIGPNFDIMDKRHPTGLCTKCRFEYFSSSAIEEKKEFTFNYQYLYKVVVTDDDENTPCDDNCDICHKVRRHLNNLLSLQISNAGRPMETLKELRGGKVSKKKSPFSIYGCCLSLRGPEHDADHCSDVTKTENALKMMIIDGEPTQLGEKIASAVAKAKEPSPHGTVRLAIAKSGKKLPITIGAAKPREQTMVYSVDDVFELQKKENLPNKTILTVCTTMNKRKRGTVEIGFQEKLKEKWNTCAEYFEVKEVEILNNKTDEFETKKLIHVKDLSEFLHFVIGQRKLDYHDTEVLIQIDKGGTTLKFTMVLRQKNEVEGEPLSSGVNKAFLVAILVDADESNYALHLIMEKINIWDCKIKFCNDLKVAIDLCGLMHGWPSYPCPYCETHKDHLDIEGKERTIKSLFEHNENYVVGCRHLKTKNQRKYACKEYKSVENRPLLTRDMDSEDADKPVLSVMPMDELHHLTGPFGKLFKSLKKHYDKIEEWADELCEMKKYQGGTFVGNDCKKLLSNIDELQRRLEEDQNVHGLPFIDAFRALESVRKACFGKDLQEGWREKLDDLKAIVTGLSDDKDIQMSCTLKFHILFFHVKCWCEKEQQGLGVVSTQTGESMHCRFDKFSKRFGKDYLRAVVQWNGKVLWALPDDEGDQN